MITLQEKATERVKLVEVDPYTTDERVRIGGNIKFGRLEIVNQDEIDLYSTEAIRKADYAAQNSVLALFVTPREAEGGVPIAPLMVLSVYSHASFVNAFNLLSNDEKKESRVLRSYWLGKADNLPKVNDKTDIDKVVSDLLVESLAEKVRIWKANPITGRLLKFKPQTSPSLYQDGVEYQYFLEQTKSLSKYELPVIKALAEGKKGKAISDTAFLTKTVVITEREIERVLELVEAKPEPSLPYRPPQDTLAEDIAKAIAQSVKQPEKGDK